ncbi:MAG: 50S ribosomal protein L11 methyltransferase [Clostridia bacterium]|nr:50S ribosomal protein L11 methyltransferase [Clostridia bacterium]
MDWFEIVVKVPADKCDTASAIANMTVPYGIYIEDYSDMESQAWEIAHIDLIDEDLLNKDRSSALIHIYVDKSDNLTEALAFLKARLEGEAIPFDVSYVTVTDVDWNENWKKYFHTTEIGSRLAVVPAWEKYDNPDNRCILKIDPGAAFGTGTHATTSLCLKLLEEYVRAGDSVLDIGCGSGILSIAGVLLGAENAVGVDIDETSVRVAKANAEMNGVALKTEYIHGDLAEKVSGKYDIVCANIVADVVMRLLSNVSDYMYNDSVLIASGIIDSRAEEVKRSILDNGFTVLQELRNDNWFAFAIKIKENLC